MANEWTNWSGSVHCQPARVVMPRDEDEVCAAVREAAAEGLPVRVAGTGHSFTPLVATHGVLILLDRLSGLRDRDRLR